MGQRQAMRLLTALAVAILSTSLAVGCAAGANTATGLPGAAKTAVAAGTTAIAREVSVTVTREFAVGAAPELVVDDQVGSIAVEAGEAGRITVEVIKRARNETTLDRIEVANSQEGDTVRVGFRLPQGMGAVATGDPMVDFRVKVPSGTKTKLTAEVGSIEVSGLTSGVTANATVGAITTRNVKGLQSLTTGSGAIAVTGADGTVQATADTGAVDVEGSLSGDSWARAQAGSVIVRLPAAASLKVTAKGASIQNDFGLTGDVGQVAGNVGAGTGGTLEATSSGSVQILRR